MSEDVKAVIDGLKGVIKQMEEDNIEHIAFPDPILEPILEDADTLRQEDEKLTPGLALDASKDLSDIEPAVPDSDEESLPQSPDERRKLMIDLYKQVSQCAECQELAQTRNKIVFGAGDANADLLLIGEAPGRDEDQQGLPFVGKAGELLTKMLGAIGIDRKEVFIANVLKCRPPQNRNPLPDEIINCNSYLMRQIELIQPKVICAMGSFAARTLLDTDKTIASLRGEIHNFSGIKVIVTYHPAYLLRNPADKKKSWEDLKFIKNELDF